MTRITPDNLDEFLSAYLDGELPEADQQSVEQLLQHDESARHRFQELKATVHILGSLPRHAAPADLLDEMTVRAERQLLLDPGAGAAPVPPARRSLISLLASAALVVLVVGGALWVFFEVGSRAEPGARRAVTYAPPEAPESRANAAREGMPSEPEAGTEQPPAGHADMPPIGSLADATHEGQPPRASRRRTATMDEDALGGGITPDAKVPTAPAPLTRSAGASSHQGPLLKDYSAKTDSAGTAMPDARRQWSAERGGKDLGASRSRGRTGDEQTRQRRAELEATLQQKLAAGRVMADYVQHRFDAELVTLDVTAPGEQTRDGAMGRLAAYLGRESIPELREQALLHFLGLATGLDEQSEFYIVGAAPQNYADQQERQVLVRVHPARLQTMVDAVAGGESDHSDVTLTVGPFTARGRGATARLLAFVVRDEQPRWMATDGLERRCDATPPADHSPDHAADAAVVTEAEGVEETRVMHAVTTRRDDASREQDGPQMRNRVAGSRGPTRPTTTQPSARPSHHPSAQPSPRPGRKRQPLEQPGPTRSSPVTAPPEEPRSEPITVVIRFVTPPLVTAPPVTTRPAPATPPATTTRPGRP